MSEKDFKSADTISVNSVRKPYALQRAEARSAGIINTSAIQQIYQRTAGWAQQHLQRATNLISRYSSANSNKEVQDSLLLSVPVAGSYAQEENHNVESTILSAKPVNSESRFSSSSINSTSEISSAKNSNQSSLTTRLQRRVAQPGLINSQSLPAVARKITAVTNASEMQQRLSARAAGVSPQSPITTALNSYRGEYNKQHEEVSDKPNTTHAPQAVSASEITSTTTINRAIDTALPTTVEIEDGPTGGTQTISRTGKAALSSNPVNGRQKINLTDADFHTIGGKSKKNNVEQEYFPSVTMAAKKISPVMTSVESRRATSTSIARMPQTDSKTNSQSLPLNLNKTSKTDENDGAPAMLARIIESPVFQSPHEELQLKENVSPDNSSSVIRQITNTTHSSVVSSQAGVTLPSIKASMPTLNIYSNDLPLNVARKADSEINSLTKIMATSPAPVHGNENPVVNSQQPGPGTGLNQPHIVLRTSEITAPVAPAMSTLVWRRADNVKQRIDSSTVDCGRQDSTLMRTISPGGSASSSRSPLAIDEIAADISEANRPSPSVRLPDLNRLAEQVSKIIARQLKIERERRGGTPWN